MAEPVCADELLRLAQKARPNFGWEVMGEPDQVDACVVAGDEVFVDIVCHERAREALHAALLVLADEEHPATTKLREDRHAKGNLVQVLQAYCERAIRQLKRAGAVDDADRLEADLAKAMEAL